MLQHRKTLCHLHQKKFVQVHILSPHINSVAKKIQLNLAHMLIQLAQFQFFSAPFKSRGTKEWALATYWQESIPCPHASILTQSNVSQFASVKQPAFHNMVHALFLVYSWLEAWAIPLALAPSLCHAA